MFRRTLSIQVFNLTGAPPGFCSRCSGALTCTMTVQTRAAQNCTAKAEQKLWEASAFITSLHMRSCFTVLDAFNSIRKQGIHGEGHRFDVERHGGEL